jgi:hypothetical protein
VLTTTVDLVLLEVAVAFWIGVPELVDIVAFAFSGTFTIVEWFEPQRRIAEQRVTHDEHVVQLTVTAGDEAAAECILSFETGLYGRHGRSTYLYPYELPVEIEVVTYKLA